MRISHITAAFAAAFTLMATATHAQTVLQSGVPVTGLSGGAGDWKHYKITVPPEMARLAISISGGKGSAEVYVRHGAQPTQNVFDYAIHWADWHGTYVADWPRYLEMAIIDNPVSGDWYISIYAGVYGSYSDVTLVATHAATSTYYVSPNGSNYDGLTWATARKTIQAAIEFAPAGSEIIVTNGIYAPIMADNKLLTIRSVNGAEYTIIDGHYFGGGSSGRCATLGSSDYQYATILTGFTLRNGRGERDDNIGMGDFIGGGVLGGTLNDCILINNSTWGGSDGDWVYEYDPDHPEADMDGYVWIWIDYGYSEGWGGGAARSILNNCMLIGNTASDGGGGVWACTLRNCTLTGNRIWGDGYGGGAVASTLYNCIVWDNESGWYGETNNYYNSTFHYSCTTPMPSGSYDKGGNIDGDPLFVNAATNNFRLQANSPCIDAGTNEFVVGTVDLDGKARIVGGRVDMGAYEYVVEAIGGGVTALRTTGIVVGVGGQVTLTIKYDGTLDTGSVHVRQWLALGDSGTATVLTPDSVTDHGGTATIVVTVDPPSAPRAFLRVEAEK